MTKLKKLSGVSGCQGMYGTSDTLIWHLAKFASELFHEKGFAAMYNPSKDVFNHDFRLYAK